jgi:hypothetical protein
LHKIYMNNYFSFIWRSIIRILLCEYEVKSIII